MKFNNIMKWTFVLIIVLFISRLHTSAQQNSDLFRKVVIFNLLNLNENLENNYFSEIISKDLAKDLERTGKYFVEIGKIVIAPLKIDDKDYKLFLKDLNARALKHSADYLIVGQYKSNDKQIFIKYNLFITRLNKIITLNFSRDNLGVFLSGLIDELSQKIDGKMSKYTEYKTNVPKIIPKGGIFNFYKRIEIKSKVKKAEIWYTLDGSSPIRELKNLKKDKKDKKDKKKKSGKSYKYTEPFTIYDSVTIKAVGYKAGYNKSDIAREHYRIKDSSSHIAFGYLYGKFSLIGDPGDAIKSSSATILTAYGYWEFANFDAVKTNAFFRNFAIYGAFDSAHAELKDDAAPGEIEPSVTTPLHFNFWAMYGGLMYKIRLGEMFAINLLAGGGMAYAQLTSDKSYDGFASYYVRPPMVRQWTAPYFSTTIETEFTIGFIFFEIGVSYKHIFFNDAEDNGSTIETLKAYVYHGGAGLKF